MKKTFNFLAATVFFFTATINAQETNSKVTTKSTFGIKGGLNFSNLYSDDVDENILTGFNVGLFTQIALNNNVAIQPELNFSTKGAELKYDNAFATGTGKFNLSYIEIPVLLKLNLTDNFNIHVGPYVAFLVDSKITNEDENGNINFEEDIDEDDLNKFDYGLAAGIGFDIDSFGLGARYNYGLATVGKERDFFGTTYTFPDAKNSTLSIFATFNF